MSRKMKQLIQQTQQTPSPRDAEEFWDDFRSRAALAPRTADEPGVIQWWKWVPAPALAAVALLVFVSTFLWPNPHEARILELEVTAEHNSTMVMMDSEGEGTIVWIDMDAI